MEETSLGSLVSGLQDLLLGKQEDQTDLDEYLSTQILPDLQNNHVPQKICGNYQQRALYNVPLDTLIH